MTRQKKPSARKLAVGIAAVVVLVLAIGGHRWSSERSERNAVAKAAAEVRACLYGSVHLKEGETGSKRLSAIEMCGPIDPARPADWPRGCREPVRKLRAALSQLTTDEAHPRLGAALKYARIAVEWKDEDIPWLAGAEKPLIDMLEDGLRLAEVPVLPAPTTRALCAQEPELSGPKLVALGSVAAHRAAEERVPGKALRAVWPGGRREPSLYCWFSPSGEPVARCGSADLENIATPLSADEGLADVYVWDALFGEKKESRIVDTKGRTLLQLGSLREHGWARADGGVDVIDLDGKLVRTSARGEVDAPKDAPRGNGVRPGLLLFGTEVEKGELGEKPPTVRAGLLRLGPDGRPTGERIELGTMAAADLVRACRGGDGALTLAYIARASGGSSARDIAVFFPDGKGGFASPVLTKAELPQSGQMFSKADDATRFGCTASGAPRWLWLSEGRLHDLSCSRKGCATRVSERLTLPLEEVLDLVFAPLGDDRVLLVYSGVRKGRLEGFLPLVRMRLGAVETLGSAPDRLLLSDEKHDGLPITVRVFAFGRGEVGWVGLSTQRQLYVLRVASDGSLTPVRRAGD